MSVWLKNTNPQGDVFVAALGRLVKAGETFEVPATVAGKPPSDFKRVGRDTTTGELKPYDRALARAVVNEDGIVDAVEVYHPGAGLLAQVGNFEQVEAPKADDVKDKGEAK
jgi:hypothetical protein